MLVVFTKSLAKRAGYLGVRLHGSWALVPVPTGGISRASRASLAGYLTRTYGVEPAAAHIALGRHHAIAQSDGGACPIVFRKMGSARNITDEWDWGTPPPGADLRECLALRHVHHIRVGDTSSELSDSVSAATLDLASFFLVPSAMTVPVSDWAAQKPGYLADRNAFLTNVNLCAWLGLWRGGHLDFPSAIYRPPISDEWARFLGEVADNYSHPFPLGPGAGHWIHLTEEVPVLFEPERERDPELPARVWAFLSRSQGAVEAAPMLRVVPPVSGVPTSWSPSDEERVLHEHAQRNARFTGADREMYADLVGKWCLPTPHLEDDFGTNRRVLRANPRLSLGGELVRFWVQCPVLEWCGEQAGLRLRLSDSGCLFPSPRYTAGSAAGRIPVLRFSESVAGAGIVRASVKFWLLALCEFPDHPMTRPLSLRGVHPTLESLGSLPERWPETLLEAFTRFHPALPKRRDVAHVCDRLLNVFFNATGGTVACQRRWGVGDVLSYVGSAYDEKSLLTYGSCLTEFGDPARVLSLHDLTRALRTLYALYLPVRDTRSTPFCADLAWSLSNRPAPGSPPAERVEAVRDLLGTVFQDDDARSWTPADGVTGILAGVPDLSCLKIPAGPPRVSVLSSREAYREVLRICEHYVDHATRVDPQNTKLWRETLCDLLPLDMLSERSQ